MLKQELSSLVQALGSWNAGEGALYERLSARLQAAIDKGEILPGSNLPPERKLAARLGISRTTVVLAYQQLREAGHVESRQGSGTWVRRSGRDQRPSPQESDASSAFRRNVVFRSLLEQDDDTIGFVGAHVPPLPMVQEAFREVANKPWTEIVGESGYSPMGWLALRQALAQQLSRSGLRTTADQLLVTSGAQQAISLVAGMLVPRGETVVAEDPTYIGAIDVFSAAGARILTVPSGAEGMELARLRRTLETRPRLLYLVPTFHNPTGTTLPERARREVAALSAELQIPVVEDLALAGLSLVREIPLPVAAFAKDAPVLTIGSLSKVFWSGLRLGWIRGPQDLIARLSRWKALADLGSPWHTQAMAVRLLAETAVAEKERRRESSTKLALLTELLHKHLPGWTWRKPDGGLLLWARMPAGDANQLAQVARRHGVAIVPGSANSPEHRFADHVRLPFVADATAMKEGIGRLARAWQEYQQTLGQKGGRFEVIV
jgi:DNA-binding transcriptional MocR family regulator